MTPANFLKAAALSAILVVSFACGDDDMPIMMAPDANLVLPARVAQAIAFEGMTSFVNVITVASEPDLRGAQIRPEDGSPFTIIAQECDRERCAVVLRIEDTVPSRGVGVPATIDATNQFLELTVGSARYRALIPVRPLDAISARGMEPQSVGQSVLLASSVDVREGATLQIGTAEPLRIVVFGDAAVNGLIDVSARVDGPAGGGSAGGVANTAGEGEGGGPAAVMGAGVGGGGFGEAGQGATDTEGLAHGDAAIECLNDFAASECGGSGGGGADSPGGAGGGSLFFVALGPLSGSGMIRAGGGDAPEAGGGSGGAVWLAHQGVSDVSIDVSGGLGAPDGNGGAGRIRIDTPNPTGLDPGLAIELSSLVFILHAETVTLHGTGPSTAELSFSAVSETGEMVVTTGSCDNNGEFSVDVQLHEGLNRITLDAELDGVSYTNWSGNNLRFERVAGVSQPIPTRATVDIVRLAP